MTNGPDDLRKFHNMLIDKQENLSFKVPLWVDFEEKMVDAKNRKMFFELVSKDINIGTYESYEKRLKKKDSSVVTPLEITSSSTETGDLESPNVIKSSDIYQNENNDWVDRNSGEVLSTEQLNNVVFKGEPGGDEWKETFIPVPTVLDTETNQMVPKFNSSNFGYKKYDSLLVDEKIKIKI